MKKVSAVWQLLDAESVFQAVRETGHKFKVYVSQIHCVFA